MAPFVEHDHALPISPTFHPIAEGDGGVFAVTMGGINGVSAEIKEAVQDGIGVGLILLLGSRQNRG